MWGFGGEIYVGYKDGTSGYWDEHGRTSKAHEFLTRKSPRKNIGANDFCGCGSAYAFKDCCQRVPATRPFGRGRFGPSHWRNLVEKARQCLNKPFVGGTPEGPGVTTGGGNGNNLPPDDYDECDYYTC